MRSWRQTTSYAYDANGNELTPVTTYADGTQSGVTYTYDKLGRIKTMSDGTRSFVYDANSNLTTMKVLNGSATAVEEDFSYDGGNRPIGLTDKVGPSGTALHTYSFTYDGRGNASKVVSDSSTTTYTYDNANQLLSATTGSAVTSYTYDANHNRTKLTTSAGTTTYSYDSSDTELTSTTDPNGKVTTYAYDASGNLSTATFDASGANQQTTYHYNTKNLLSEIDQPDGGTVSFTYDADGNRLKKTVVSGGPVPTQTMIKDVYQAGRIAYETDGAGTTLATFSYDPNGAPESVVVGSDSNTSPRYYYVYNAHGDVVALVDKDGNIAARYSYDEFGSITDSSESFANGWSNPYRYDGIDRVRYDSETGLYWMSVRAYDPTLGRFISRDPEGRTPLIFATQPYAYAGNNPLRNVDPSGQHIEDPNHPGYWVAPPAAHVASTTMNPTHPTSPVTPVVHITCDPDAPRTQACRDWKDHAYALQSSMMQDLDAGGQARVLWSIVLDALAAGVALATKNTAQGILEVGIDMLETILFTGLPAFGSWLVDTHRATPDITNTLRNVAAGLGTLLSLAQLAWSWWKGASWVMQVALNGAVIAVKEGVGGAPAIIEDVTLKAFGGFMSWAINGVANSLMAQANAVFASEGIQKDMGIVEWCNQYGGGGCGPLPTD